MGRAGQRVLRDEDRLADRVSIGVLAKAFPRETVEAVIEAATARLGVSGYGAGLRHEDSHRVRHG